MNTFCMKGASGALGRHKGFPVSQTCRKVTPSVTSRWQCRRKLSDSKQSSLAARSSVPTPIQQTAQQQDPPLQQQHQQQSAYNPQQWQEQAASILSSLDLPIDTQPEQLWSNLSCSNNTEGPTQQQQQIQQQLQQSLNISSWRLLQQAALSTCHNQQQHNQLQPLINAATAVFHDFALEDFRQLLQLCARCRYIPDKEWLAAVIYADTGGFERLYQQSPAADVVHLLADLSAVFASHRLLLIHTQQQVLIFQSQQQQRELADQGTLQPSASSITSSSSSTNIPNISSKELAAEVAALQAALQTSTMNLMAIQQDDLLAGELSAVGGYWLIRRLLPQLTNNDDNRDIQRDVDAALRGFGALQGLNYKVLDSEESDVLINLLTAHLPTWSPHQLAAALSSSLPCLGQHAPSDGQGLALLFAAAGAAAAAGLEAEEAGRLLVVLSQIPGYAPDAKVAQALLDCALQPPLTMTAKQLYQLLSAASELEAAPRAQHLQLVQDVLKG